MREILQSSIDDTSADFAENILVILSQKEHPEGYHRLAKKYKLPDDPRLTGRKSSLSRLLKHATVLLADWTLPGIEQVPNLKIIQLSAAGFDRVVKQPIYTDTKITFCTSNGIYSLQHSHIWNGETYPWPQDLLGSTIGILGYSSIGRQVARVASGLGMKIHAYTASPRRTPESKIDRGYILPGTGDPNGELPNAWFSGTDKSSLHTFLSGIDVLVCSLPLTDSTRHMLSTAEFEILGKRKAYVVNISRGAVIDHDALTKALKGGLLAGASLDVTEPEPLPPESELWDMKNVVITPHISGVGKDYVARVVDLFEVNLGRLSAGESLFNVVKGGQGVSVIPDQIP
ncbi:hypothetical protein L873DRAFT_1831941 [Choiromyces venosus 120613-1]|uniref:D-isomer specific 2-hydroxyacid dehydrogenase NAD-binding domain-containing protein n=1 Tax=Choiromyces venosus 120613-1 TaxID=1336337 RepID=A0A3N4J6X6_9PEZI|nr:hypothetical protein L873DRAFT_1831941 [Choiromyces venosus 120613-1]